MPELPGNDTVGIVKRVPVLDGGGNPVLSDVGEPQTTEQVTVKTGCLFEVYVPGSANQVEEVTTLGTTDKHFAWVFLPVDDDTAAIAAADLLRYPYPGDQDWEMRGDAVVEKDLWGSPDHVFAACEKQQG